MSVAVLLLLGLGLLGAEGRRNRCYFNRTQERCVCYNLTEETAGSLIQCLAATVVEFRGGELEKYIAFPIRDLDDSTIETLGSLIIQKVIIADVLVPEILLARVLRFFSYTHVKELAFDSCVFQGTGDWHGMDDQSLPILSLSFNNVTSAPLMGNEQAFSSLSTWLETLQELAVTSSSVTSLPCAIGKVFGALHTLDLAQNSLGDGSLTPAFCQGAFPQLQVLSLQHNNLTSYHSVCEGVQLLQGLQNLNLSQNKLMADPSSSCQWPASLRVFNLSHTGLEVVLTPLPPNLEVLDMSHNHLRAVDISLSSLKKLFLSQNLLQAVPSLRNYPVLDTLHLDNNSIAELPWDEVTLLGRLQDVTAANNPFNCSCSGAGGLQALAAMGHLGQGWPQDYTCQSPPRLPGWRVVGAVSVLRCHRAAVVAPLCVALALLGLAGALCLLRARPCRRAEQDVSVRAAVGLHQAAGPGESWADGIEDTLQLLFAGKEPQCAQFLLYLALVVLGWGKAEHYPLCQESSLAVDGVFHLDAGQEKVLELARPQLALVPLGYSVSLLLWDPHGPGTQLPFQSVIWQVIDTIFQELEALGDDTRSLQTVSLVQVSTHDKAWDLLHPDGRALQVMDVTPLGLMVEEATEIAVPDAQAAISAYARGLGAIPALSQGCARQPLADGHPVQGAGSLFTLTVERELEGGRCQRSALRILVSPGATGPCPRLEPDTGCQPWIVERLLEGNSLTFLLLCVSLPDTSREEILGALGLAERVKGLAKTISATLWDPAEEITARRREIRGLRVELLAGTALPEQRTAVAQLRRALRELQVLKSQRWEKKQAAAEVLQSSEMHQPSAKVGRGQARPPHPGTAQVQEKP
ncbi:LOW QUALITY PROTEIN: uncharacterized protein LOC115307529 [Manacus vitellinus]|uniref:LOW QUALITY PROTEIN: uncharacterized protein LOC115307529 n=1 Tax=Manacus vitellinus TaxID=328815 RepID=UPI00115CE6B2|nr:LOW QUALITY PROTEIN: uncharacterized protein LOC115307529 [Manacus vitellinus]